MANGLWHGIKRRALVSCYQLCAVGRVLFFPAMSYTLSALCSCLLVALLLLDHCHASGVYLCQEPNDSCWELFYSESQLPFISFFAPPTATEAHGC